MEAARKADIDKNLTTKGFDQIKIRWICLISNNAFVYLLG
jgi:hypothetical protein